MLIDGLKSCGLLLSIYQLFGLSFWRHPFTAKDPLVSKWCNVTFLQICSDEETNSSKSRMAWEWVKHIFLFSWTISSIYILIWKWYSCKHSYSHLYMQTNSSPPKPCWVFLAGRSWSCWSPEHLRRGRPGRRWDMENYMCPEALSPVSTVQDMRRAHHPVGSWATEQMLWDKSQCLNSCKYYTYLFPSMSNNNSDACLDKLC